MSNIEHMNDFGFDGHYLSPNTIATWDLSSLRVATRSLTYIGYWSRCINPADKIEELYLPNLEHADEFLCNSYNLRLNINGVYTPKLDYRKGFLTALPAAYYGKEFIPCEKKKK